MLQPRGAKDDDAVGANQDAPHVGFDPVAGVAQEANAALGVKALDSSQDAEVALLHEILERHVRSLELMRLLDDEGEVRFAQAASRLRIAIVSVAPRQV